MHVSMNGHCAILCTSERKPVNLTMAVVTAKELLLTALVIRGRILQDRSIWRALQEQLQVVGHCVRVCVVFLQTGTVKAFMRSTAGPMLVCKGSKLVSFFV